MSELFPEEKSLVPTDKIVTSNDSNGGKSLGEYIISKIEEG